MIFTRLNQSVKAQTAAVIAVAFLGTFLVFTLGGAVLAMALSSVAVGGLVHRALGEPERLRQRVRAQTSELKDLAYRDSLTGLPNRRSSSRT